MSVSTESKTIPVTEIKEGILNVLYSQLIESQQESSKYDRSMEYYHKVTPEFIDSLKKLNQLEESFECFTEEHMGTYVHVTDCNGDPTSLTNIEIVKSSANNPAIYGERKGERLYSITDINKTLEEVQDAVEGEDLQYLIQTVSRHSMLQYLNNQKK